MDFFAFFLWPTHGFLLWRKELGMIGSLLMIWRFLLLILLLDDFINVLLVWRWRFMYRGNFKDLFERVIGGVHIDLLMGSLCKRLILEKLVSWSFSFFLARSVWLLILLHWFLLPMGSDSYMCLRSLGRTLLALKLGPMSFRPQGKNRLDLPVALLCWLFHLLDFQLLNNLP